MTRRFGLAAILLMGGTSLAWAEAVSIGAARDNTLYEIPGGILSNGAGQHFFAGTNFGGVIRRGLIAFDVAGAVPAGTVITDVSLTLHMSRTQSGPQEIALHRALAAWGEGASDAPDEEGGGAASQPGDATWMHTFYDTAFWDSAGGDFAAEGSASLSVAAIGFYTWTSVTMRADAQGWLDNPGSNHGWLLRGNEQQGQTAKRFDTRENPEPTVRPLLQIRCFQRGDCNCNDLVDLDDIDPFVLALSDPAAYGLAYPNCDLRTADCNADGGVDFDDVNPFVALLGGESN